MSIVGKRVGGDLYIHKTALKLLTGDDVETVRFALAKIKSRKPGWNVVRLSDDNVGFQYFKDFDKEPFPRLENSLRVDLFEDKITERSYKGVSNPPILHRKELLVKEDYPNREVFSNLTERLEELGLFYEVHKIGYLRQWSDRLNQHEIKLSDHEVVSWAKTDDKTVYRYRTAITRYQLSQPSQLLMRHGLLNEGSKFFDYGCGRGDDIETLKSGGINAAGWDPHFANENEKIAADVVNIGFVLNVIEDIKERNEALSGAWKLTKTVLSVAVMAPNSASIKHTKPYGDGFLTTRGTFQKYYPQEEIKEYITLVTSETPIAIAPGIFLVFRDKIAEQDFLLRRLERSKFNAVTLKSKRKKPNPSSKPKKDTLRNDELRPYLDELSEDIFDRGRVLDQTEVSPEIRDILKLHRLSLKKVQEHCIEELIAPSDMDDAIERRKSDLLVYLALEAFSGRKQYRELSKRLQLDLRTFWGSYANAEIDARNLLFSIGDIEKLKTACEDIADEGLGYLIDDEQLQFHSSILNGLPPILRCYVGCGGVLYGDIESAELIKIHINTGKLTLQVFDNFLDPLPELRRRIKIDMRAQRVQFFDYGDRGRSYLYMKSLFIPDDFDQFDAQTKFDQQISKISNFDFSNYGPTAEIFDAYLDDNKISIDGYQLRQL